MFDPKKSQAAAAKVPAQLARSVNAAAAARRAQQNRNGGQDKPKN